ncbi:protein REVERSION-TO-ETHYLENE SENSITIVITY1 [Iris pallida]|uniref:Protein REVERSION-TO-ETHYLENE SENSITIVITY1 n=1 Tax=Iris pallida TaxID=29817 RepID=A0AAX6EGT3_IRIPA|nr:protein REVERSION-TO-ETHYLENE SENSITIVITY1 [Iris pallida]
MSLKQMSLMEFKAGAAGEDQFSSDRMHDVWPLDKVNAKKAKFPCCLVWTSLPIVSWLAPYMGHVGICREDGVVLDFSGSHFVGSDSFSFGSVARYLQLDREQCCFPPNLAGHTCEQSYSMQKLEPQSRGMMRCTRACCDSSTRATTSSPAIVTPSWPTP